MNQENLDFSERSVHLETVYPHEPERVWDALLCGRHGNSPRPSGTLDAGIAWNSP